MRKYIIKCQQGTNFKSRTEEEPQTRKELIDWFKDLEIQSNNWTLSFIADTWEVSIYYINSKGLAVNIADKTDILKWEEKYKQFL